MTSILAPSNAVSFIRGTSQTLKLALPDTDLTGALIYFTLKRRISDGTPLIQKTNAQPSEITVTLPREGKAEIYLLPADTASLDPGLYAFDVWVILADGKRHCAVLPTDLEVLPSVTVLL